MADFGLYSGLMRKSNIFETKAQNRQMEMQIQSAMEQRSEQKLQEQAAIDAKMQEFFNSVNELDILEKDQTRVQAKDKELRANVINSLKQTNGDVKAFMMSGGAGVLNNYYNNLMQSEEVTQAIENKTNFAQWSHAQANGMFVKEVGVDVDVVNPDGTVGKERRVVTMDEANELFEKGKIAKLPWDGAEKDVPVGNDYFQKLWKNPADPYSTDNEVMPEDVYLKTIENGGSVQQAQFKAKKYQEMLDNGATTWRYRTADPLDRQIKLEQLRGMRTRRKQSEAAASGGYGKTTTVDFQKRIQRMGVGGRVNIMPDEWKILSGGGFMGLRYDNESGKYIPEKFHNAKDVTSINNPDAVTYNLQDFNSATPLEIVKTKDGLMMKMQVEYDIDSADENTHPLYDAGVFGGYQYSKGAHINNWNVKGNTVSGAVYVPAGKYLNDDYYQMLANKEIGVNMNQEKFYNPTSQQEQVNQLINDVDIFGSELQNIIGVDPDEMPPELQYQLLNELQRKSEAEKYSRGSGPGEGQGAQHAKYRSEQ